jgi:O-antigen/teichoic acid export membrane protein
VSLALLGGQILLREQPDGYAHIAEFSVAYRWHLAIVFVPVALVPAAIPILTRLQRRDRQQARDALRFTLVTGVAMAAVPAAIIAVAAPWIMGLSGDYYGARPWTLVVLAVAAVPLVLNNILSSAAISLGAVRAWLVSDVVLAVGVLALALALVPSFAAAGLALAYLGGYLLTDLALMPAVVRHARKTGEDAV